MLSVALPVFVSVTVLLELLPKFTLPKATEVGLRLIWGDRVFEPLPIVRLQMDS